MDDPWAGLHDVAVESGFSGAVRVDDGDRIAFARAYGLADRAHGVPNTLQTRFAIASATKGWTALVVVSLVETGLLRLGSTARAALGRDLPLIDDSVTVEQLLAHRSGIGDYLDEETVTDPAAFLLPAPVGGLLETEDYLPLLDGHATKFPPGDRFAYCNSGYVVLALLAERVSGRLFRDLVRERVSEPAGLVDSSFTRSDELDGRTARGYLSSEGLRTNIFHLPARGSGDGGLYATVADVRRLWTALFAGRIVPPRWVAEMTRPRSDVPSERMRYGLGLWLDPSGDAVVLEGYDAGVSFRSVHDPGRNWTGTVVANTTDGAWPIARLLGDLR